jgi:SET domain-containing protein
LASFYPINVEFFDELKFCCEKNTVAFYAYAVQDIQEGEEITIDYGPDFFEDCPCVTCKRKLPDASDHSLGKRASKNREEIEEEKREKKRAKRQKQKEKKLHLRA